LSWLWWIRKKFKKYKLKNNYNYSTHYDQHYLFGKPGAGKGTKQNFWKKNINWISHLRWCFRFNLKKRYGG
jgi:hypothetical protein